VDISHLTTNNLADYLFIFFIPFFFVISLGYHWGGKKKKKKKEVGCLEKNKCQANLFQKPHYLSKHMATLVELVISLEFSRGWTTHLQANT
jgi:fucose 4-O-acetylase-like acetyltransferase